MNGKSLQDTWGAAAHYGLSLYGQNAFVRFFRGSVGSAAAALDVSASYDQEGPGAINWNIANLSAGSATVVVHDAYLGSELTRRLASGAAFVRGT